MANRIQKIVTETSKEKWNLYFNCSNPNRMWTERATGGWTGGQAEIRQKIFRKFFGRKLLFEKYFWCYSGVWHRKATFGFFFESFKNFPQRFLPIFNSLELSESVSAYTRKPSESRLQILKTLKLSNNFRKATLGKFSGVWTAWRIVRWLVSSLGEPNVECMGTEARVIIQRRPIISI